VKVGSLPKIFAERAVKQSVAGSIICAVSTCSIGVSSTHEQSDILHT
jgi:hypothetical protein